MKLTEIRRNRRVFAALVLVLALMLSACGSMKTYRLNELLPEVLDDATLLPVLDSVTVTRVADGAAVTLSETDVENLMLCFDNIVCTREKLTGAAGVYVLSFALTDPAASAPPLVIDNVDGSVAKAFEIGGYRYVTVNMTADLTYLMSLFG